MKGLGASLTESSAFVLAHLTPNKRSEVLTEAFGPKGFSMVRTHIGSCDFTVDGSYSYRDHPDTRFSLDPDRAGFHNPDRWPGVHDRDYDLLPLIQEVFEIQPDIQLIASPWTAPPWMKSPEIWFRNGFTDEQGNQHYGTGGRLLPEHHKTFSDYLVNYVQHMKEAGIPVWAVTPVNEPIGNGGKWESMHMEPIEQAEFIAQH
ncbi:MAG: glycosyl hydrolase, partial [Kiritimatiellae bacterium]|nr:glycosyl hydrolase [Kiritimatiellia bacterium]